MREYLVNEHLTQPTTGDLNGWSFHTGFLEVGSTFCDDRYQGSFGNKWPPNSETDQTVWSCTAFFEGQRIFDEMVR